MDEFLTNNPEDGDYNQYWYSPRTIATIVEALVAVGGSLAFLSTPSLYFSLPDDLRARAKVYDFDKKWNEDPGFVFYDFNAPEVVPPDQLGTFDVVVIDPPFITHEVWEKYATTAKLLLKPGGKVVGTTVFENSDVLNKLLGLSSTAFQPSIPNLVYQYNLFTNFECPSFTVRNPEIPQ